MVLFLSQVSQKRDVTKCPTPPEPCVFCKEHQWTSPAHTTRLNQPIHLVNTGIYGEIINSPGTSRQTLDMKAVLSTLRKGDKAPLWESLTSKSQIQQSTASSSQHITMNGTVIYMVQLWPSQVILYRESANNTTNIKQLGLYSGLIIYYILLIQAWAWTWPLLPRWQRAREWHWAVSPVVLWLVDPPTSGTRTTFPCWRNQITSWFWSTSPRGMLGTTPAPSEVTDPSALPKRPSPFNVPCVYYIPLNLFLIGPVYLWLQYPCWARGGDCSLMFVFGDSLKKRATILAWHVC